MVAVLQVHKVHVKVTLKISQSLLEGLSRLGKYFCCNDVKSICFLFGFVDILINKIKHFTRPFFFCFHGLL